MADPPKEDQPPKAQPQPKRPDIQYDDIVAKVVADASKPQATRLLSGYVGRGGGGRGRNYPDLSFSTYEEVAEDDIVHSIPIADSPLGGSHVWVKSGFQVGPTQFFTCVCDAAQKQQPPQAFAAAPFPVVPNIPCGLVCHTVDDCRGGAAHAAAFAAAAPQAIPFTAHGATCNGNICNE